MYRKTTKPFLVFLGILNAFICSSISADVVLEARKYSGKDNCWVNRFTSQTMALKGNHKVISGFIWWDNFPESGKFKVTVEGVTFKRYGKNPVRFYVNDTKAWEGKTPYPAGGCNKGPTAKNDQKLNLGEYEIHKNDKIKYWGKSVYCAGLSKPGAYASFKRIRFVKVGGASTKPVASPAMVPEKTRFLDSVSVEITCATAGAAIHYTLDGKDPTQQSTPYSKSFTLTATTTVKARGFKEGMAAGPVASRTYTKAPPGALTVQVTAPNGGETFTVGQTMTVTWKADLDFVYDTDIFISADGGRAWKKINDTSSVIPTKTDGGAFSWKIPKQIEGVSLENRQCLIRVLDYTNRHLADQSDKAFTILPAGTPVRANAVRQRNVMRDPHCSGIYFGLDGTALPAASIAASGPAVIALQKNGSQTKRILRLQNR